MPDVLPISDYVARSRLEPGDILAFYGDGFSSRLIELVTWGPSHVGIVAKWEVPDIDGDWVSRIVLVESTSLCVRPCLVAGQHISGVQAQDPWQRIGDYNGQVRRYRLADHWTLGSDEEDLLTAMCRRWMGRSYDYRGALWSGTKILKWLPRLPYSDLGSLFCSELIAACLQRLGRLCVSNAGVFNPGSLVRTLVKSGVYLPGEAL